MAARGVKLGNPNGAHALRDKQAGNKEAVASIKVRAQERAENLWAIVADMRNNGHTGLDIAVELRSSRRAVASTVARMTRCFIIEGGDNRKINVRPRARRCGGLARVIATLGPPSHELFLGLPSCQLRGGRLALNAALEWGGPYRALETSAAVVARV